jgi:hypothetical protein
MGPFFTPVIIPIMRARKVRCRPRPAPPPSTKGMEGVRWFRHSPAGRAAKDEKKWELYRAQGAKCARCLAPASLDELRFESKKWSEDSPPRLVHAEGKCLPSS